MHPPPPPFPPFPYLLSPLPGMICSAPAAGGILCWLSPDAPLPCRSSAAPVISRTVVGVRTGNPSGVGPTDGQRIQLARDLKAVYHALSGEGKPEVSINE